MGESFAKKEQSKKKAKKKQDKAQKMIERKSTGGKKTLEDMMAYVDEYGNITDTPPVPTKKKEINLEDIQLGAAPIAPEDPVRKGTVLFFDDAKGYGFIAEDKTEEKLFVHSSALSQPIKQRDKVSFEREKTARGYQAIMVKKI